MHQPEGFNDGSGRVCHLKKALYGAVQSPRAFNQKISKTLLGMKSSKMIQSTADPCLYISEPPRRILALIYVDDGCVAGSSEKIVREFITELGKTFELTSRPLEYFLGIHVEISLDKSVIWIHQRKYIEELLERFKMRDCKPSVVPIDNTSRNAYEGEIDKTLEYRQVVGGLLYACIATRAECCYAVGFLSRYLDKPTKALWNTAMKVLRYLNGTKSFGLIFTGSEPGKIMAWSDADWSGCDSTRRSTSGSHVSFGRAAIAFSSQRQGMVTLSTLESELVAASETAKTVIWVSRLLKEAGYETVPELLIDNQSVIHLINNPQTTRKCKHIQVRHYFVREQVQAGSFPVKHCPGTENVADLYTKSVPRMVFQKLRALAGIKDSKNASRSSSGAGPNKD